ncbi:LysM peptidoglycan-binding domain-containing protein [Microbacterium algeriense]|uniref:LysM peptidoglycan-binding domain-containing protein n=1 Tax=Microbacterium algeriense TaxID=2615184 RepID=UPI0022E92788|nr:LysM peptidoglycan-binding domain-containing protein [Microbacterium algeriense]
MKRVFGGLASLVVLIGLLVGIPAALVFFAGNPFPTGDELSRVMSGPDVGGVFFVGTVLPLIGWIAWLSMAIAILVEIPAQIRRMPAPKIPGLGLQQKGASVLIGAIVAMVTIGGGATAATAAELPAAPTTVMSQSFVQTSTVAADASSHVDEAAPAAVQETGPTYTVQDGDSLWQIAEKQLGQGERWQEIADLNYGVEQADGWALDGQHWLNAGWVLKLPADAASPAAESAPAAAAEQHTVVAGDTLWDIAEDATGDGANYHEIFEASKDTVQPTGHKITDPNLIYPGDVVTIPGAAASVAPAPTAAPAPVEQAPAEPPVEAPAEQAAPSAEGAPAADAPAADAAAPESEQAAVPDLSGLGLGTPSAETKTPAEEKPAPAAAEQASVDEGDDWIDELFNVRTIGGLGAIAAAGLLSLLGIRRMKQRRRRRPGQRIAMPQGEAGTMELELRAVENPMGMEHVDHALRHLAIWAQDTNNQLPQLYALRLSDAEIALYLEEPFDLPAPFAPVTDDKTAWTVDPEQLPELERIPSSPWPALVTIGQDQGDAHLMVDLEHIGALNLTGNPSTISGALTGLAVELATSQWADDLSVTLVGIAPGLPAALDTGRIRHIDDVDELMRVLRSQAASTKATLDELGVNSIEEARSLGMFAEAWTPEIVILGEMPDEATKAEIADLVTRVPRVGVAAIAAGELAGEWTLHLTDDKTANLNIPAAGASLPLTPQIVNEDELRRIMELFATTEEAPTQTSTYTEAEISLEDIPAAAAVATLVAETPAASTDWRASLGLDELPAQTDMVDVDEEPAETADEAPAAEAETAEHAEAAAEAVVDVDEEPVDEEPAAPAVDEIFPADVPWLQILGPVTLHNAQGPEPRTPQTSEINRSAVVRSTELLAFLALNPGASAISVHDALWPGKLATGKQAQQNRNGLASKARKWIGVSADEEEWFPKVGAQGYRLHELVRTDWDVWKELIGDDLSKTSTENLIAALRLVQGQPFSGVREKYYRWAEVLRTEIIQAIGDAAHELVTRSLRTSRIADARLAATVGRQIDPVNETLWRDAMLAESLAGDKDGFERIVSQHEDELDSFEDGYEPEPETVELIDQIRGRF